MKFNLYTQSKPQPAKKPAKKRIIMLSKPARMTPAAAPLPDDRDWRSLRPFARQAMAQGQLTTALKAVASACFRCFAISASRIVIDGAADAEIALAQARLREVCQGCHVTLTTQSTRVRVGYLLLPVTRVILEVTL